MLFALDEHRTYLADRHRLDAFRRALQAAVRPGDVVLDLGCGTGILGFLACDAGARHVYAVDDGPIIGTARRFARANGYADRITYIRELSTLVTLPEPVDVVVCDQLGPFGFEAGVIEYLADACRRLLKPDGRVLPQTLTLMVSPAEAPEIRARVEFWSGERAGLDVTAAREAVANTAYPLRVDPAGLLAEPAVLGRRSLRDGAAEPIRGGVSCRVLRAGTLDGICGWFSAELAPGVEMTNMPGHVRQIDRGQVLLPLDAPLAVDRGDQVAVAVDVQFNPPVVTWRVTVTDHAGRRRASSTQSTFRGMLLSAEDLSRADQASRPVLNRTGRARQTVLNLCDGTLTLREIEDEVRARHADLFATPAEAATFVAEIVTAHATAHASIPHRQPDGR